jgi:hypothetical protein
MHFVFFSTGWRRRYTNESIPEKTLCLGAMIAELAVLTP